MRSLQLTIACLICALVVSVSPQYVFGKDVRGVWRDPKSDFEIETYTCPHTESLLCGRIVRISKAALQTDRNNPDPRLRDRTLLGLQILEAFQPTSPDHWEGGGENGKLPGRIYLPLNGDTLGDSSNRYQLSLSGDTITISVANCHWLSCLGKSVWQRIDARQ